MTEQRFGPYRLVTLLGRGGMGEVWRAVDTDKDRVVALKVLGSWLGGDPDFAARFRREAELAARLTSPHIVPIHDYGEVDGRLYLEMPLLTGADLATLLDTGPLPPARAVDVVAQAARALAVAHRAGLVHRDVKPSNIHVSTTDGDDHAYLIDFGIAKALDGTRLSMSGSVVGTAAYMAPECFAGEGDARSDIYSLGCVLYEALTGQPPFRAPHAFAYANLHQSAPLPQPSAVQPGVPAALDAVVARAMAKRPEERYATVSALADAARAALQGPVPTVVGPPAASTVVPPRPPTSRPPGRPVPPGSGPPFRPDDAPTALTRPPNRGRTRALVAAATAVIVVVGLLVVVLERSRLSASAAGPTTAPVAAPKAAATLVGLITPSADNPYFVKMTAGARQAAQAQGVRLEVVTGDGTAQAAAVERFVAAGASGLLIDPADAKGIVPALDRARQAGLLVVALNAPPDPATAADAVLSTDSYTAGQLIGQWARADLGAKAGQAKIAMLDLNANQVSVDVQRDQGFLDGFGVDVHDRTVIGDETDPRIVGHDVTDGSVDGGRTAMENLLQKDPSTTLVYTINEPAAAGAYQALKAAGRERDVTIVSIDGGCPGVAAVKAGQLGATAQQYPDKMGQEGVAAVVAFARDGTRPQQTAGKTFVDTGVTLITDRPQAGVDSRDTTFGAANCWG